MQPSSPILRVSHLTTRLKLGNAIHKVVDNLSFDLFAGRTLALVGESGCGKTMTALSLMRILPDRLALPPEGEVLYQGKNLLAIPENEMRAIRGARLAMIFQDPTSALNPVFSIGDQLMEVAALHLRLDPEEAEALAIQALDDVGITHSADRLHDYPHQLSGGMRQRVMIAMALLCEPDVLIADEPTTALDMTVQAQVLTLIRQLQRKKGTALLLITHDLGVVAEMADEVIVMYASQAVEQGQISEVFREQAHPYTEGLFQSRPNVDTPRGHLHPIPGSVPSLGHYPHGCHYHPRCPYVMPVCRHGEVPNFACGQPGHISKCWLWDSRAQESR
jgi:peptide/nickel transport system ATP-binding protein